MSATKTRILSDEQAALSVEEIREAQDWWRRLPSQDKGNSSIWVLLAMYARDYKARHGLETPPVSEGHRS